MTARRCLGLSLALVLLVAGACSGHDVSLGDSVAPAPFTPTSSCSDLSGTCIEPGPGACFAGTLLDAPCASGLVCCLPSDPGPRYPCELHEDGFCFGASEHCSGRPETSPGYECGSNSICCIVTIGVGLGGADSGPVVSPFPLAGAGGAP
jgi:hypothetical protein